MQKNIYFKSQQINLTEIQVEDAINSYPTKWNLSPGIY